MGCFLPVIKGRITRLESRFMTWSQTSPLRAEFSSLLLILLLRMISWQELEPWSSEAAQTRRSARNIADMPTDNPQERRIRMCHRQNTTTRSSDRWHDRTHTLCIAKVSGHFYFIIPENQHRVNTLAPYKYFSSAPGFFSSLFFFLLSFGIKLASEDAASALCVCSNSCRRTGWITVDLVGISL